MLLETLRILADHLADPTVGLGATLATTPRDGSDPLPATPAILEETSDLNVALGRPPASLPALTLTIDGVEDLDPRVAQQTRDASVAVLVRLWYRESETDAALRDAYYTLRALERSVDLVPETTRNGVTLYVCTERAYVPKFAVLEDALVLSASRSVWQVREDVVP